MMIELDGIKYDLKAGDSIYFDSSRSHRFANESDDETTAIVRLLMAPPAGG